MHLLLHHYFRYLKDIESRISVVNAKFDSDPNHSWDQVNWKIITQKNKFNNVRRTSQPVAQ